MSGTIELGAFQRTAEGAAPTAATVILWPKKVAVNEMPMQALLAETC
ncbi:hypothetical protein ACFQX9_30220 [Bradyrhizobium sp. GCM10028915]